MSNLTYLQRLAISIVFGSVGTYLLARFAFHFTDERSNLATLLYVVFILMLVALAQLRDLLGGAGETAGFVFAATIGGLVNAWQRVRGRPAKEEIKEKIVRAAMAAVDAAPTHTSAVNLMKLNVTLDAIVTRAHESQPWSRETLVKADITTQGYWNLANHILKLLGLRKDRSTRLATRGSIEEDLRFIRHNVKVIEDIVLVKENGRNGWRRIDLKEAGFLVKKRPVI